MAGEEAVGVVGEVVGVDREVAVVAVEGKTVEEAVGVVGKVVQVVVGVEGEGEAVGVVGEGEAVEVLA